MPLTRSSAVRTGEAGLHLGLPGHRAGRGQLVARSRWSARPPAPRAVSASASRSSSSASPAASAVAGLLGGRDARGQPLGLVAGGLGRGVELGQPPGRRGGPLVGLALPGPDLVQRRLRRVDPRLGGAHAGLRLGRPAPGPPPPRPAPACSASAASSSAVGGLLGGAPGRGQVGDRLVQRGPHLERRGAAARAAPGQWAPTRSPARVTARSSGRCSTDLSARPSRSSTTHARPPAGARQRPAAASGTVDQVDRPLGAGQPARAGAGLRRRRRRRPGRPGPPSSVAQELDARRPRLCQRLHGDGLGRAGRARRRRPPRRPGRTVSSGRQRAEHARQGRRRAAPRRRPRPGQAQLQRLAAGPRSAATARCASWSAARAVPTRGLGGRRARRAARRRAALACLDGGSGRLHRLPGLPRRPPGRAASSSASAGSAAGSACSLRLEVGPGAAARARRPPPRRRCSRPISSSAARARLRTAPTWPRSLASPSRRSAAARGLSGRAAAPRRPARASASARRSHGAAPATSCARAPARPRGSRSCSPDLGGLALVVLGVAAAPLHGRGVGGVPVALGGQPCQAAEALAQGGEPEEGLLGGRSSRGWASASAASSSASRCWPCASSDSTSARRARTAASSAASRSRVVAQGDHVVGEQAQPGVAQVGLDDGGLAGDLGLAAQRLELAAQLGGEVLDAGQVGLHRVQLAQRLLLALAVLEDARRPPR